MQLVCKHYFQSVLHLKASLQPVLLWMPLALYNLPIWKNIKQHCILLYCCSLESAQICSTMTATNRGQHVFAYPPSQFLHYKWNYSAVRSNGKKSENCTCSRCIPNSEITEDLSSSIKSTLPHSVITDLSFCCITAHFVTQPFIIHYSTTTLKTILYKHIQSNASNLHSGSTFRLWPTPAVKIGVHTLADNGIHRHHCQLC